MRSVIKMARGPSRAGWLAMKLGLGAIALAVVGVFFMSIFGIVAYRSTPAVPAVTARTFLRPMASNCNEVFFCINSTDPNPSYLPLLTAGPSPQPWLPQFGADTSVFDVSDPYATVVRVAGTYQFTLFVPVISFTSDFVAAIVVTRDPGILLQTPALTGVVASGSVNNITAVATMTAAATAIATLDAGTPVRVGYVVNVDGPMVPPGAYFGGVLLART